MAKKWPSAKTFNREAVRIMMDFVTICQCQECGYPHADGYCCTYCGNTDPRNPKEKHDG